MKVLISVVVGLVVVIAFAVGVVALIGSRLPRAHSVSRSIFIRQSPQQVYVLVRDFGAAPAWRVDLKTVEVETQPNGKVHFREQGGQGTVNYELAEDVPAQRMVTKILDTDLGYGGQWTYVFAAENGGTRLTITEDGEVSNVLFRFMSRYIFGHTATLDSFLTDLAKRFGEPATPQ